MVWHTALAGLGFLLPILGALVVRCLAGLPALNVTSAILDVVEALFFLPLLSRLVGTAAKTGAFAGAVELVAILAGAVDMARCLVRFLPALGAHDQHLSLRSQLLRCPTLKTGHAALAWEMKSAHSM